MPELPDVTVYIEALERRIVGAPLERIRIANAFILRTFDPPIDEAEGKRVVGIHRSGKRILWELDGGLWLVFHLMIAGRLRWRDAGFTIPKKLGLAAFDFPSGTLLLTEAGSKKRAALHLFVDRESAFSLDRGGIEVIGARLEEFRETLVRENHTLKRALTDPRFFSGIGNAYSDEILHRARLSPILQTRKMTEDEIARLYDSTQLVLELWIQRLRDDVGDGFPEKVTAFREDMAVHGRFGKPCPDCGAPVQRIQYASNETNYCARCQTGGRVLADRSLSRMLKGDWPKSIEELEG